MAEPNPAPLAHAASLILVGRDRSARWVVTEIHGRCGGLFCDEASARRYAKEMSEGHPEAIHFAQEPIALQMPGSLR